MAKRNLLKEVKAISTSKPKKIKEVFAYSDEWEVWEFVGDDDDDPESWAFLADGSFSECIQALHLLISIELDYQIQQENKTLGTYYDDFFAELAKRHRKKQEEIRQACFKDGCYENGNWTLRSVRNRQQCEWIAKNGLPN